MMSQSIQWQRTPQEIADVLKLVVEKCPAASEIRTLCSLLKVSRTVQQAMQQAVGHCSLVIPKPWWDEDGDFCFGTVQLASCCSWLPKHAGLVRELSFTAGEANKDVAALIHHMFNSAFQLCAARAQAGGALPLRLQSLTMQWDVLHPSIAEPLSVCTGITDLDLFFTVRDPGTCAELYAAIGRLQGLRQLKFRQRCCLATIGSAFTNAISPLTNLQRLELGGSFYGGGLETSAVRALPASLRGLTFMMRLRQGVQDSNVTNDAVPAKGLNLHHLVHLQELSLRCPEVQPQAYSTLAGLNPVVNIGALQQLRSLQIADGLAWVPVVKQLSSVQTLQTLEIGLGAARQLSGSSVEVLRTCLNAVAAATQLTKLSLVGSETVHHDPVALHSVKLHGYLAQLKQLQDLTISSLKVQSSDAVLLTKLQSLTPLHMHNVRSLDDATAAAVACRLPKLRALTLFKCGARDHVLLLVGLATGLESLGVSSDCNTVLLDAAAMGCLTGLTRLTSLRGPVLNSSVEYQGFRAAMPALVDVLLCGEPPL